MSVKLRNIGPKSAAWLRQVGLRSLEDLAAVGAVEAYMKVRRAGFNSPMPAMAIASQGLTAPHSCRGRRIRRGSQRWRASLRS